MLQNEIQKIENLYKELVNNYEDLRFKHCTTIQELGSFKQTYKQVEEENGRLSNEKKAIYLELSKLKEELDKWKNLYQELPKNLNSNQTGDFTVSESLKSIENTIQQKNNSIKEILIKLTEDIQNLDTNIDEIEECNSIIGCDCTSMDSNEDAKEKLTKYIKELEMKIDNLVNLSNCLQNENKKMKSTLWDKKEKISTCLGIFEKNNDDITNLCSNIENISKERDQYMKQVKLLKNIVEKNKDELFLREKTICQLKCQYEKSKNEKEKMEKQLRITADTNNKKICGLKCYAKSMDNEFVKDKENNQINIDKYRQLANALENEIENQGKALCEIQQKYMVLNKEYQEALRVITQQTKLSDLKSKEMCGLLCYVQNLIAEFGKEKSQNENKIEETLKVNKELQQKIKEQADVIAQFKGQCTNLQQKKIELENELILKTESNDENLKEVCGLKCYIKTLNDDTEDKVNKLRREYDGKIEEMTNEISEKDKLLKFKKVMYENYIQKLEERNESLENTLSDLYQKVQNNDDKDKIICGLECFITSMNNKVINERQNQIKDQDNIEDKLKRLDEDNRALNDTIEKLARENDQYKRQLQDLNVVDRQDFCCGIQDEWDAMLKELKKDLDLAKLEIAEYEEQTNYLMQQLNSLEKELDIANEDKLRLSEDNEECCKRMHQQYGDTIKEKQKIINEIQEGLEQLKTEQEKFLRTNRELEKKLLQSDKEKVQLRKNLDEITDRTQKQIEDIQCKIEDLEQQDKAKQRKLDRANEELEKLRATIKSNKNTEQTYTAKMEEIESKRKMLENENAKLTMELDQLMNNKTNCDCKNDDGQQNEMMMSKLKVELYQKQCTIYKLEQCIDKSNQVLGECEREIKEMHCHNECLQRQNSSIQKQLNNQIYEIDIHKADKEILNKEIAKLRQNLRDYRDIEIKIAKISQECNRLLCESGNKDAEIVKLREQLKAASVNAGETCKKVYAASTQPMTNCVSNNKYVKDLERKLQQREQQIQQLKLKDDNLTSEIGCLKQYVHKLILNNNKIKAAVSSLVAEIMNKLNVLVARDCHSEYRSAEEIAADILKSLTQIEYYNNVTTTNDEKSYTTTCPIPKCSCMVEIMSKYGGENDDKNDKLESGEVLKQDVSDGLSRPGGTAPTTDDVSPREEEEEEKIEEEEEEEVVVNMADDDNCEGCEIAKCSACPSLTHCLNDEG